MTAAMHPRSRMSRAGFTLIELLVVFILLAVLSAFVLPSILDRSDAAEPNQVASDLRTIDLGLALFRTDTRLQMPGDLEDLVNTLSTTADKPITGGAATYSTGEAARWKGPYLKRALPVAGEGTGTAFSTGYGAAVGNDLVIYDDAADTYTSDVNAISSGTCGAGKWAAVVLTGIDATEFGEVNAIIDGSAEGTAATEGNLRFKATDPDSTFYLAVPCAS